MGKIRGCHSTSAAKGPPGTFKNHENIIQNRLLRKSVLVVENATFGHPDEETNANVTVLGGKFFILTGAAEYLIFS